MDQKQFIEEVTAFLMRWRTASLATVDESGQPHAANVQYACDGDLSLVFVSSPESAHSRHVALDPHVAMTIYGHVDDWSQIHGVQLHGRCEELDNETERQAAWDLFTRVYPFVKNTPSLVERIKQEKFYRIRPSWLRWIDNRRGFGFKHEGHLEA